MIIMKRIAQLFITIVVLAGCRHTGGGDDRREVFDAHGALVYTVFANRDTRTMSVVYGNTAAIQNANSRSGTHHAGEELTVVTYQQQNNKYWYGSYINGRVKSVEKITMRHPKNGVAGWDYHLVSGSSPLAAGGQRLAVTQRVAEILGKRSVVFP